MLDVCYFDTDMNPAVHSFRIVVSSSLCELEAIYRVFQKSMPTSKSAALLLIFRIQSLKFEKLATIQLIMRSIRLRDWCIHHHDCKDSLGNWLFVVFWHSRRLPRKFTTNLNDIRLIIVLQ
jgi:hypothetical protein